MRFVVLLSVLLATSFGSAFAQVTASASFETSMSKAALSGEEVRLWGASMLDPDCSAHGRMITQILDDAHHGGTRVSDEPFYPQFPSTNSRAACNTRKSPGRQIFYTSEPGFRGVDTVVFQNATSEGTIRRWTVTIDVK